MTRRHRPLAAVGALALAAAGLTVFGSGPAAAADPVTVHASCDILGKPATVDQQFTVTPPTTAAAPGSTVKLQVHLGPSVPSPADFPGTVPFTFAMDTTASGGATGDAPLTGGSGTVGGLTKGSPVTIPDFTLNYAVPANATGDVTLTPQSFTVHAVADIKCTASGAPALTTVKVDPNAKPTGSPTPTGTPTSIPDPMDPVAVDVNYTCKTVVQGIDIKIPDTTPTFNIKIGVQKTANPGDKVNVTADVTGGTLGNAPSIVPAGTQVTSSPTLTILVDDGNKGKSSFALTAPPSTQTVNPGDALKVGQFTGTFTVWGGGLFSFQPGDEVTNTNSNSSGLSTTSTTTCTMSKTGVSAQLKAVGSAGTPPPSTSLTQTINAGAGTGGTTGGGLAHTGSSGGGVSALAMLAGTLVLLSGGVLLFLPNVRRRMGSRG